MCQALCKVLHINCSAVWVYAFSQFHSRKYIFTVSQNIKIELFLSQFFLRSQSWKTFNSSYLHIPKNGSSAFVGHTELSLNGICLHSGWATWGMAFSLGPQESKRPRQTTQALIKLWVTTTALPLARSTVMGWWTEKYMAEGGSTELWSITNPTNHNNNPIIQREKQLTSPPPYHTSQPKVAWESSQRKMF